MRSSREMEEGIPKKGPKAHLAVLLKELQQLEENPGYKDTVEVAPRIVAKRRDTLLANIAKLKKDFPELNQ